MTLALFALRSVSVVAVVGTGVTFILKVQLSKCPLLNKPPC